MDKLEEAESQRKTEEEVTEPQPMVFGRFTKLVWWDLCLSVSPTWGENELLPSVLNVV